MIDKHDMTYIDCPVPNTNLGFPKIGGFGSDLVVKKITNDDKDGRSGLR